MGLQYGDTSQVVSGVSVAASGLTTSTSGFPNVGTYATSASGGEAADASGAYRLIICEQRPLRHSEEPGTPRSSARGEDLRRNHHRDAYRFELDLTGVIGDDNVGLNDPTTGPMPRRRRNRYRRERDGLASAARIARTTPWPAPRPPRRSGSSILATLTASLVGTVEKTYDGTSVATLAPANYQLSGEVSDDTIVLTIPPPGPMPRRTSEPVSS